MAFPLFPIQWQLPVVAVALFTEYLDGAFCRWFGWASDFGRLMDPIADKVFVLAVVVTLLLQGWMGWLELLLIGIRDVVIVVIGIVLIARNRWQLLKASRPRILGKVTTVLQFLYLLGLLYFQDLPIYLAAFIGAVSLAAAADYVFRLSRPA